jgi:predicted RND superfamily exporter protein
VATPRRDSTVRLPGGVVGVLGTDNNDLRGDASKAIRESLLGTGRAMLITSVILGTMFLCNLPASLSNFHRFGVFSAPTVAFALLADFVLAPALLILLTRRRRNDLDRLHI